MSLFKVVTILEIDAINRLEVHRGADPTIELLVNEQVDDDGEKEYHRVKILFPGDMERQ